MWVGVGIYIAAALAAAPGATEPPRLASAGGPEPVMATGPIPQVQHEALGAIPPSQSILDSTLDALPPAPQVVTLQTGYYGTMSIDHRAPLARKISCKMCHGPGQVGKIAFTPRIAHDRCVECHRVEARGPTACNGCHVKPPLRPASSASDPSSRHVW